MSSSTASITPGTTTGPSITIVTYIPAPPQPPPPAIPQPVVVCSDNLSRALQERYKNLPRTTRKRFVYSPAQADAVARRELSLTNGLKDSRSVTVSLGLQIGIGQRVEVVDDSDERFVGIVHGVEINQTGRVVTKTLLLRRVYE